MDKRDVKSQEYLQDKEVRNALSEDFIRLLNQNATGLTREEKLIYLRDLDFEHISFKKQWSKEEKENNREKFNTEHNISGSMADFFKSEEKAIAKYM